MAIRKKVTKGPTVDPYSPCRGKRVKYKMLTFTVTHSLVAEGPAIHCADDLIRHKIFDAFRGVDSVVESIFVFFLDARGCVMGRKQISVGTLTASLAHPREVFAAAVEARCASIILAHNHPSGSLEPSAEDIIFTRRMVEAGEIMGIPVVDSIIVVTQNGLHATAMTTSVK